MKVLASSIYLYPAELKGLQVVMSNPVTHEILRDVQGTNVWSGQQIQSYNSDAVAWGALGKPLYAQGTQYAFVPYVSHVSPLLHFHDFVLRCSSRVSASPFHFTYFIRNGPLSAGTMYVDFFFVPLISDF
jgi:hypothetical protein